MKKYIKPEMTVVVLQHKSQLLVGSGVDTFRNRKAFQDEDETIEADQL